MHRICDHPHIDELPRDHTLWAGLVFGFWSLSLSYRTPLNNVGSLRRRFLCLYCPEQNWSFFFLDPTNLRVVVGFQMFLIEAVLFCAK